MELAILNNKTPVKAIPEDKLNEIILTVFIDWLSGLLSLTGETSSDRLEIALPAIKEHCWSMGFDEIKKMFEMYADNKLSIEPVPNYFDRILFGKIVKAYKSQKPIIKKQIAMPDISQEEKDNLTYTGVINCFDEFKQSGKIINGYTWVYDHLEEKGFLKYSKDEKRNQMPIAKQRLITENKQNLGHNDYKQFTRDLENKRVNQGIINTAKKMLLERYFLKLTAKEKHIKDIMKQ